MNDKIYLKNDSNADYAIKLTSSPDTAVPADGKTYYTVYVAVTNNGQPVGQGDLVTFSLDGSAKFVNNASSAFTDVYGVATSRFTDTKDDIVKFTAYTANTSKSKLFLFEDSEDQSGYSIALTASPTTPVAPDGVSYFTVHAAVTNNGQPVRPGELVKFSLDGSAKFVNNASSAFTDAYGVATARFTDTKDDIVKFTASTADASKSKLFLFGSTELSSVTKEKV